MDPDRILDSPGRLRRRSRGLRQYSADDPSSSRQSSTRPARSQAAGKSPKVLVLLGRLSAAFPRAATCDLEIGMPVINHLGYISVERAQLESAYAADRAARKLLKARERPSASLCYLFRRIMQDLLLDPYFGNIPGARVRPFQQSLEGSSQELSPDSWQTEPVTRPGADWLLACIYRHYPAGLGGHAPAYLRTEEHRRLKCVLHACAEAAGTSLPPIPDADRVAMDTEVAEVVKALTEWRAFKQALAQDVPNTLIWDQSPPWHEPVFRYDVPPLGYTMGSKDNFDPVVCVLSALAPVYALYTYEARHSPGSTAESADDGNFDLRRRIRFSRVRRAPSRPRGQAGGAHRDDVLVCAPERGCPAHVGTRCSTAQLQSAPRRGHRDGLPVHQPLLTRRW